MGNYLGFILAQEKETSFERKVRLHLSKVNDRQTLIKKSKVALVDFERKAVKGETSTKKNGVKLTSRVKLVPTTDSANLEVAWALSYHGPRPPLTIVKPTFAFPTGSQTMVYIIAFAKGKDYGFSLQLMSPYITTIFGRYVQVGPYLQVKELPTPQNDLFGYSLLQRKKWFITVPKGKTVKGTLTISVKRFKEKLMHYFPGEFDEKEPPRLFLQVIYSPNDRGEYVESDTPHLDAWVGELSTPINKLSRLKQW